MKNLNSVGLLALRSNNAMSIFKKTLTKLKKINVDIQKEDKKCQKRIQKEEEARVQLMDMHDANNKMIGKIRAFFE